MCVRVCYVKNMRDFVCNIDFRKFERKVRALKFLKNFEIEMSSIFSF